MGAVPAGRGGRALGTLSLSGTLPAPAVGHTPLLACELRGPRPAFRNGAHRSHVLGTERTELCVPAARGWPRCRRNRRGHRCGAGRQGDGALRWRGGRPLCWGGPLPGPPPPAASPPTFILWISAFMALISVWPVSESTEARISFASWIFFSQSMIWCL